MIDHKPEDEIEKAVAECRREIQAAFAELNAAIAALRANAERLAERKKPTAPAPNYDTREERDMDLGGKFERLLGGK